VVEGFHGRRSAAVRKEQAVTASTIRGLKLADRVIRLAARFAPYCPGEAASLLIAAARIFRENGRPSAGDACAATAGELRAIRRLPRSRPFMRPAMELGGKESS
jgi:hypothetical protein